MNGYKLIYMPEHPKVIGTSGCVYEHIIIAEQKLGRFLTDDEVVHHLDENRSNNLPENLIVFKTKADHSRYHKTGLLLQQGEVYVSPINTCTDCGAMIDCHSRVNRCRKCANVAQRKAERPSYEQLLQDKMNMSMCAIGRKYGVSDNTIRKWLKYYEGITQLVE